MNGDFYIKLGVMCLTLYAIRCLPFLLLRREIKNRFIRSFLTYVPYVTLAVMTFPAILTATDSTTAGAVALFAGVVTAWAGGNLILTAAVCCAAVLLTGLIL